MTFWARRRLLREPGAMPFGAGMMGRIWAACRQTCLTKNYLFYSFSRFIGARYRPI
jgi:hypothetical protein